jgi:hypothetical protein
MKITEKLMRYPGGFKLISKIVRFTPTPLFENIFKEWSNYRTMPQIPKERFIS